MPPRQPSETCLSDKIGPQLYTRGEVARHSNHNDMWVIVDDKVYDVTTWARDHPGGRDILYSQAGRDATDSFYNFHHADSIEMLPNFYIGDLEESDRHLKRKNPRQAKIDEILRDYRELTDEARRLGYFKSSKLYYSWKVGSHFLMLATFVALLTTPTWARVIAASLVAAVFYSQNGWLAHDFLHHQVFEDRRLNNAVGMMLGGLFQGFSVAWWKNKHNAHHASSNELDNDPDIDQLPLLSFHPVLLRGGQAIKNSKLAALLIPIQVFTFTPLIFFARWNWCARSVGYLLDKTSAAKEQTNVPVELAVIAVHWIVKATIFFFMDFTKAFTFLMVSEAVGGLMIGFMFVLNHNGMHVFTEAEFKDMDFVTLQVLTSRDVKSNFLTDFFSGGLNYQVEHHLFPSMPRHYFHKIAPMVDKLCQKHGIPVHRVTFWEGVKEFWASLEVSQDCVKQNKYEVPRHPLPHYGKSQ